MKKLLFGIVMISISFGYINGQVRVTQNEPQKVTRDEVPQDNKVEIKTNHLSFTLGINFGIFFPSDMNAYAEDWLEEEYTSSNSYISSSYNLDMYLNWSLSLGLSYRINKFLEVKPMAEFSASPKLVAIGDDMASYSFNKVSLGGLGLFHIPMGRQKSSFFIGAGPFFNRMRFKEIKGSDMGWRLITGFSLMNHKNFNPQIFMGWDQSLAYGDRSTDDYWGLGLPLKMNYSSFKIGTYLNF